MTHIAGKNGFAVCGALLPKESGETPCVRCLAFKAKREIREQKRTKKKAKREALKAARLREFADGVLVKKYTGIYYLRYTLGGKIVENSLRERNERRAKMLVEFCMRHIRFTGRRMNDVPTCNADKC